MINKIVTNDSYDFGQPSATEIPSYSRGFDLAQWQRKYASENLFAQKLASMQPRDGETVLHIIALGDEEVYGPNRNCDGFARQDNIDCHKSFVDLGHLFRDHKNTDPELSVGRVIDSCHNPAMGRVELLVGLDHRKCRRELDALGSGKDLAFSMGSAVDYDICSWCRHKAPTAADHCEHIQHNLGEVMADGTKVYMKNPRPKFFDISIVWKPADRIAYMLKKVANGKTIIEGGHELAVRFGITGDMRKVAELRRIAEVIKQVPLGAAKVVRPTSVCADTRRELRQAGSAYGVEALLDMLTRNGMLLGPSDFADIAVGHPQPEACCEMDDPADITELLQEHVDIEGFEPPMVQQNIPLSHSCFNDLERNCSMQPEAAQKRTIIIVMTPSSATKLAAGVDPTEQRGLQALYQHYKLAFLRANLDRPRVLRTAAATFAVA